MVTIDTKRLHLRRFMASDLDDMRPILMNPSIAALAGFSAGKDLMQTKYMLRQLVDEPQAYAMMLTDSHKVIGNVALYPIPGFEGAPLPDEFDIGYALNPDFWHHGYMTEALGGLVDDTLKQKQNVLLHASVIDSNAPSIQVLKRVGFVEDGYLDHPAHDFNLPGQRENFYRLTATDRASVLQGPTD